ncbi:MAG: carbamoyltransferase HypF, partial [Candidatus Udaeobacter sp.]
WVLNSVQGVFIEVEGAPDRLRQFLLRLEKERPPRAVIHSFESSFLDPVGYDRFEIRETEEHGEKTAFILPDIATCADCLRDIFDSNDRRFRYPFTNCTNCGPRFSIIEALPYDRKHTSMQQFAMCDECESEYKDPRNRRFHAQPNACPRCGPHLEFWDPLGAVLGHAHDALLEAARSVRDGKIVALKGIGGFQLIVDARSEAAVVHLRERKRREEKPFAVMYPSLNAVRPDCEVSEWEKRLLLSAESPIVLLSILRNPQFAVAPSVAPGNPNLGVMLPYTPLHHLLTRELGFPIVATSGNLSDEPICIDNHEALNRLHEIADFFLVNDRPIVRHVDDSIVRVVCERELVLRRARGFAPLPIHLKGSLPTILAVGAHLKNTVALSMGNEVFVSQHIGDLETEQAYSAFKRAAMDLPQLYDAKIDIVACDMHPDYLSTKYATEMGVPVHTVQHHWAHAAACMGENGIEAPALGVSWDGTGFGLDGTVWGGEFLLAASNSFTRVAHFRQFALPGGETAIKEPRRSALGLLHEIFGDELWTQRELLVDLAESEVAPLRQMFEKKINTPKTSSVGRLFDAVASLSGLRHRATFEGQAAMELEFALQSAVSEAYPYDLRDGSPMIVDWEPAIRGILADLQHKTPVKLISAKFHNMLAETIVAVSRKIGESKVVLSGGCFQNRYLIERTVDRLREENFRPYWHQRIPPNDGGIALGQVIATAWAQRS